MADARDLLVEIGTEELPSSELLALGAGFARALEHRLGDAGLEHGDVTWYATPRRLAVQVSALASAQADATESHRGPPVSAAFDAEGNPSKAAEGFAKRHGVSVDALERRTAGKADYLFFDEDKPGRATADLLPEMVDGAARAIPAKKRMRWGVPGVAFPRPVHWTVLFYGDEALEAEILGTLASRETRGHRFHHPGPIVLATPEDYVGQLEQTGWVTVDVAARRARIRTQVEQAAVEAGGTADIDDALLDEVTALVEWPVALAGSFDRRFLDVPPEALVAVMKDHQRYFPVRDAAGALLPAFVTVSNIASDDPETVRAGNERVIAPRLADAEFFWQQDRRRRLETRREGLRAMVFQRDLGSLHDRSARIARLATYLANLLEADTVAAERAGELAKCDLLTEMVSEFPELQGLMGGYYAAADGEGEVVARAIADQYRPAYAGDALPRTPEGRAVALADRLDALVGIFAIGQGPSGDKDPFASRRAALGALRILIERGLDLDLERALAEAAGGYDTSIPADEAVSTVFDFAMDRLRTYYSAAGYGPDQFEAVLARRPTRPLDFDARMQALSEFRQRDEFASLVEANKRIRNILRKAGPEGAGAPDPAVLIDAAERELAQRLEVLAGEVEPLFERREYAAGLRALAGLAAPLDRFFDDVMVMTEDTALRANRLALLERARALFLRAADLSQLQSDA